MACFCIITHRVHGAGIYANIWGILMVNVTIYSSTMDPMGYVCGLYWDCAEQLWGPLDF